MEPQPSPGLPLCWFEWWERGGSDSEDLKWWRRDSTNITDSVTISTNNEFDIVWFSMFVCLLFWALVWFFSHSITMNKLPFGGLNSADFWRLWTNIWTFLSLNRFLSLDLSGMAWRHSKRPKMWPDQPGAIVSLCLFLLAFPYNANYIGTAECFCSGPSGNE